MSDDAAKAEKPAKPAKPPKPPKPDKPEKAAKPDKPAKGGKKGFNWVLVLVPVAVISAFLLALALPVTHALIVNSPLRPLLARIGLASLVQPAGAKSAAPVDLAAEVKRLSDELETDRKAASAKDARITQLQSQLAQQQAPAAQSGPATAVPKPSPTPVSDALKRVATYWAGMDAEKAADVIGRLPDAYVRDVLGQMPADAVAEIMNVLPAKTAARLTANAGAAQPR